MNDYVLLHILAAGVAACVALLIVASILLGRSITLVWRANRRLVVADKKSSIATETMWKTIHAISDSAGVPRD